MWESAVNDIYFQDLDIKLTDWRGNEYGIGDIVVYPRMFGNSVDLHEATILDIVYMTRDRATGKMRPVEPGEQSTILRVKVQPNGPSARRYRRTARPSYLYDLANITKV